MIWNTIKSILIFVIGIILSGTFGLMSYGIAEDFDTKQELFVNITYVLLIIIAAALCIGLLYTTFCMIGDVWKSE